MACSTKVKGQHKQCQNNPCQQKEEVNWTYKVS